VVVNRKLMPRASHTSHFLSGVVIEVIEGYLGGALSFPLHGRSRSETLYTVTSALIMARAIHFES
jgi:hypothetical protein